MNNNIFLIWKKATAEERFEFLCELDSMYRKIEIDGDSGDGLLTVYRSFLRAVRKAKGEK